mmetsp:Transcript_16846/g.25334  ORF Transcript_16846/g.25334 Transcript_16846/m.25334 type:complete len:249 (-) Transcript_16846:855-1601(-)
MGVFGSLIRGVQVPLPLVMDIFMGMVMVACIFILPTEVDRPTVDLFLAMETAVAAASCLLVFLCNGDTDILALRFAIFALPPPPPVVVVLRPPSKGRLNAFSFPPANSSLLLPPMPMPMPPILSRLRLSRDGVKVRLLFPGVMPAVRPPSPPGEKSSYALGESHGRTLLESKLSEWALIPILLCFSSSLLFTSVLPKSVAKLVGVIPPVPLPPPPPFPLPFVVARCDGLCTAAVTVAVAVAVDAAGAL